MRWDLNGDGQVDEDGDRTAYFAAYPGAVNRMGCPASGCGGYELVTNLDFGTAVSGRGWLPIGTHDNQTNNDFNAVFDGNGHIISNLYIARADTSGVGLFAVANRGSDIKRVGLVSVNVIGNRDVGGLAGWSSGAIAGSYVTGNVIGDWDLGGLVGQLEGSITDSYAAVTVSGRNSAGGLVGASYDGTVSQSHATGNVSGSGENVGGLVAWTRGGAITASYATGSVTGAGSEVGGLVGENSGTIFGSYASGEVSSGNTSAGGLVGVNGGAISASYATGGAAARHYWVGGLVGENRGTISHSYSTGSAQAPREIGGLVGRNSGTSIASYWDIETSGLTSSSGGIGLTTAELQAPTGATGIYADWNPTWWDFGTSGQYPVLRVGGLSVALQRGQAQPPQTGTNNPDRAALVALYNAAGGANWTNNANWNTNAPLGEWHGVDTDGNGRVTSLGLGNNGLNGSIPPELGNLANLTELNLQANQLSGTIPSSLGNLTNLIWLNLARNGLTGTVPAELGNLSNLIELDLTGNQLSGCIPLALKNLSSTAQDDLDRLGLPFCPDLAARDDRSALVAFYNAAGGPNWTNNANWNTNAPLGDWHGVATDANGRVTELRLPGNGLSGRLPAELGSLAQLSHLDLDYNGLSGSIPSQLGNLSNLSILRLGSNQLSGAIPSQLGNLSNLTILGLGNNQLTGSLPRELGNLTRLTRFSAWNNQLSGSMPAELGNLTALTRLSLGRNQLDGSIPAELGNLGNLEHLILNENELTGTIPPRLGNLTRLLLLDLDYNRLTGPIPSDLGNLASLTILRLGSNELSGSIPSQLGNLSNLAILGLGNNRLTGSIPPELGNLTRLTRVSLWNNRLTGPIPSELGNLSNLTKLVLGGNQLSGSIPSQLGNLTNLEELALQSNQLNGPIPLQLGRLVNLTHLTLKSNRLSGPIPPELGQLVNLVRLYLYNNQLSGAIPPELGRLSRLEVLNLSDNRLSGGIPEAWLGSGSAVSLRPAEDLLAGRVTTPAGQPTSFEVSYPAANPDRQLRVAAPAQSNHLAALRVLNLSNNRLTGAIPSGLDNLASLNRLYLKGNQLTGNISAALRQRLEVSQVSDTVDVKAGAPKDSNDPNSIPWGVYHDCNALMDLLTRTDGRDFFDGTGGDPNWDNYYGWEENIDSGNDKCNKKPNIEMGEWHGVVTENGRVVGLFLQGNNLDGNITEWATKLTDLTNHAYQHASYTDAPLHYLQFLHIQDNSLEGDYLKVWRALPLPAGVQLAINTTGDDNNWYTGGLTMESVIDRLADGIEELTGFAVDAADEAKPLLIWLRKFGATSGGRLVGKLGSGLGWIGTVLENQTVTDAIIGIITGKEREEIKEKILDDLRVPKSRVNCLVDWDEDMECCITFRTTTIGTVVRQCIPTPTPEPG